MSQDSKKPVLDPMEALLKELNLSSENDEGSEGFSLESNQDEASTTDESSDFGLLDLNFDKVESKNAVDNSNLFNIDSSDDSDKTQVTELSSEISSEPLFDDEATVIDDSVSLNSDFKISILNSPEVEELKSIDVIEPFNNELVNIVPDHKAEEISFESESPKISLNMDSTEDESVEKTVAIKFGSAVMDELTNSVVGDRTIAVSGYSNRSQNENDNLIKVSVGQISSNNHNSNYSLRGLTDSQLAQAENLKIAQTKILDLEKENEKLRSQNQELISASEIIKERSDLLNAQVYEYKNDRESLENSFKNEMALIKSQLNRKDIELQRSHMKIDDLDSRLKFDMKKIRIRERELENRLELLRAEKNALVRNKDEQILDSRRKIDQLQLEVDSFRQKCVELNRALETNQDSFKRTTRALRLAMANLELQDENKIPLKKVD